jgi:hypothetical protein
MKFVGNVDPRGVLLGGDWSGRICSIGVQWTGQNEIFALSNSLQDTGPPNREVLVTVNLDDQI